MYLALMLNASNANMMGLQPPVVETVGRKSGGQEVGLAERLGLHAPFCTFRDDVSQIGHGSDAARRKIKRRRTSSSSSRLEPAPFNIVSGSEETADDELHEFEAKSKRQRTRRHPKSDSEADHHLSDPPPARPKNYERRSRYKTREDKYSLKQKGQRPTNKQKDGIVKKVKKRKRKEKSGNALMHDFAASNVAQDRLTVSEPISSVTN